MMCGLAVVAATVYTEMRFVEPNWLAAYNERGRVDKEHAIELLPRDKRGGIGYDRLA
jgi:hypothetical protein